MTSVASSRPVSAAFSKPHFSVRSNSKNALLQVSPFSRCTKLPHNFSHTPTTILATHSAFKSCLTYKKLRFSSLFALPEQKRRLNVCRSTSNERAPDINNSNNNGNGGEWTTSILLFGLWAGLLFYVFILSPNQTPNRDVYFLQKLLNLKGDDGFRMNQVLVSLWYIMGFWPLVYSMLLVPSGRSSKSKVPAWPFLVLSCFGGAYALIPYFVLWQPPAPAVEKSECERWPLNFLDSKITAVALIFGGVFVTINAGVAGGDAWKEFYQYFRESKFIHATCIDFLTLSSLCPFWVYNDMTYRNWLNKGSWLLPLTLIPYLGPALYLALRPPLPYVEVADEHHR
ncbi:hypothetical protein SUGI_0325500 [Cryptomeria japonica]|nr:hypothetical protein SUGI_0325500 [Cryptomeria japonica]